MCFSGSSIRATTLVLLAALTPSLIQARHPPLYHVERGIRPSIYFQNSDVDGITGPGTFAVREGLVSFTPLSPRIIKTIPPDTVITPRRSHTTPNLAVGSPAPEADTTINTLDTVVTFVPTGTFILGTTRCPVVPGTNFFKPTFTTNAVFGRHTLAAGAQILFARSNEFKFAVPTPMGDQLVTIPSENITDWNFAFSYGFKRGHQEPGFFRSLEFKAARFDVEQKIRKTKWDLSSSVGIQGFSFIQELDFDASYATRPANFGCGVSPVLIANRYFTLAPQIGYEFDTKSVSWGLFFRDRNLSAVVASQTEDGNKTLIFIIMFGMPNIFGNPAGQSGMGGKGSR